MPTTRRTLTLALLLVAAGSLAFATGATVVDGPADTVADGDLAVQPADGPNGQYAYLNDDGEITVDISPTNPNLSPDFEGVNPDSLASANGIFTITYTGDEYAHVWIDHEGENVTFLAGDESVEGEANNVTLAPNETVAVGLDIDTHGTPVGTQVGTDEFSISAKIAEPDEVTAMGRSTRRSAAGGPTITTTAPSADRREFRASGIGHGETLRLGPTGCTSTARTSRWRESTSKASGTSASNSTLQGVRPPSRTGAHWRRRRPPGRWRTWRWSTTSRPTRSTA